MLLVHQQESGDVLHSNGVEGWNHDLTVRQLGVDVILVYGISPLDPLLFDAVPHGVVDCHLLWESHFR